MLRIDRESRRPLSDELEQRLTAAILARLAEFDAVLISDYAKGVCTSPLVQAVIAGCRKRDKPVLIDPARRPDYRLYAGATLVKPNRTELQLATGWSAATLDEAAIAGRKLCRDLDLQAVVSTLDRDGMLLIPDEGDPLPIPTTPLEVCDVTGAGDMSLAMLGLCLAGEAAIPDAVRLANVAAGLEVQRLGIATVTRTEIAEALVEPQAILDKRISRETAGRLADEYRRQGRRIVFTNGCFDLLHVGHLACLREAKALGDVLFVAINSDASVRRLKGATRPVIHEEHRAELLAALECVDHVIVFDEDTPHALLDELRPHRLVKGGTTTEVIGDERILAQGGDVELTTSIPNVSTSNILLDIWQLSVRNSIQELSEFMP